MWFLQLWAQLHFKDFFPADFNVDSSPTDSRVLVPQLVAIPIEPLETSVLFQKRESAQVGFSPPLQPNLVEDDHQHMIYNWSRVLVVRDITNGIKHSSRYNQVTTKFSHPNFAARKLGLGQYILFPYESLIGSIKWEGAILVDLIKLLNSKHQKFSTFIRGNYKKTIGETSAYTNQWLAVREFQVLYQSKHGLRSKVLSMTTSSRSQSSEVVRPPTQQAGKKKASFVVKQKGQRSSARLRLIVTPPPTSSKF